MFYKYLGTAVVGWLRSFWKCFMPSKENMYVLARLNKYYMYLPENKNLYF